MDESGQQPNATLSGRAPHRGVRLINWELSYPFDINANPEVSVEVGTAQFKARATIAEEPERTKLFDQMVSINPGFAEYRSKTTRVIPVIILDRLP